MKRLKKSLTVPTMAVCTLGWAYFALQAVDDKGIAKSESIVNSVEDIEQFSLSHQLETSYQNINTEYERLKEEERKRLEELERQRLEKLEQERLAKIKAEQERQRLAEEAKKKALSQNSGTSDWMNYQLTHYTAFCAEGCTGVSATGDYLGNSEYFQGYRVIAAPKNIPFYSIVRIQYPDGTQFDAIVLDRGGAIKGRLLDVLVSSESKARTLGRQNGKIKILRYGKGE